MTQPLSSSLIRTEVTNPNRMISIANESYGWWAKSQSITAPYAENYSCIIKAIRDTALSKIGYYNQTIPSIKRLTKHKISAVYDSTGNLQGVATFTLHPKKNIVKIHKIATAIWNLGGENLSSNEAQTGVGKALILNISEVAHAQFGKAPFIFAEPTKESLPFYEKNGFSVVEGWTPKEFGSCYGVKLRETDEVKSRLGVSSNLLEEDSLPFEKTILHYPTIWFRDASQLLEHAI
jgi:hypothetical protein